MPQFQINGSMVINSGQIASSNNGFFTKLVVRFLKTIGIRVQTQSSVRMSVRFTGGR